MIHLMQPRYKVIADYPKSPYPVGTIINAGGQSEDLLYCNWQGPRCRDYPHLFKSLQWWEDRQPEEMPQYVKRGNKVFKTDLTFKTTYRVGLMYLDGRDESGRKNFIWLHSCLPATLEEYTAYQTRHV